ncbi:MAG: type II toxin-antitoxin system prevent-host-death family antitoxin [Silvibacterium sp.]
MTTTTIHQAKTQLSRLLEKVEGGEEVVILRGKLPIARLVPIKKQKKRNLAVFKGNFRVDNRFFEPLPEEELRAWNGENA